MNWTNEKIFDVVFGTALVLFFIYITIMHFYAQYMFTSPDIERRYTIATVTKYLPGFKTPPRFRYEFTVNHKKYVTTHSIISKIRLRLPKDTGKYIGKKFYLLFVVDDEINYSKLLLYKPVKDNTLVPPPEGWKELPE